MERLPVLAKRGGTTGAMVSMSVKKDGTKGAGGGGRLDWL
jgi:hypothetical protein